MSTVSVICPCGSQFDRPVRRGRPQVWCPPCAVKPFESRVRSEVVVEEVVMAEVKANKNDRFWRSRDVIEAGVVEVDADFKTAFAALVAAGADPWGSEVAALSQEHSEALKAVYGQHKPDTASKAEELTEE